MRDRQHASRGECACVRAEGKTKKGKKAACPTGCSSVDRDRGFSTRLMWRRGGGIVTYAYYPDKPKSIRCGEDWKWSEKLQSGKWHEIKIWLKLNTVSGRSARKDGQFKAWLDGEQARPFSSPPPSRARALVGRAGIRNVARGGRRC